MECVNAPRCRSEWSGRMGELPIIDIQLGCKVIIWMAVTSTCAYNEKSVRCINMKLIEPGVNLLNPQLIESDNRVALSLTLSP